MEETLEAKLLDTVSAVQRTSSSPRKRGTCLTCCSNFSRAEFEKKLRSNLPNIPAALLVIYTVPCATLFLFLPAMAYSLVKPSDDCLCGPQDDGGVTRRTYLFVVGQKIVFSSVFPFAGWLADVKWGRHKVMRGSLFLQWVGVCFQAISLSLQYTQCGLFDSLAKYVLSTIAFVLITLGLASFFANVLAYGMEQMLGAPSMALRSYINWCNWAILLGMNLVSYVQLNILPTSYTDQYVVLSMIVTVAVSLTAVLCLDVHFHDKFVHPKLLRNPYRTILGVLLFAWKHKVPVQRSAFTYWEEELPSRLDLAKTKYGGPFSHSSVEDVKTTLRIVAILLSLSLFTIAYDIVMGTQVQFASHFKQGELWNGVSSFLVYILASSVAVPAIPILELLIVPLFPKLEYFLVNHLRVLGITCVGLVISTLLLLILELFGHSKTDKSVTCFLFSDAESMSGSLTTSFLFIIVPDTVLGLVQLGFFVGVYVFICSQAPLNMNGMLIGLFFLLYGCYEAAGLMILYPFIFSNVYFFPTSNSTLSCGFWLFLIALVLSILGCLVYLVAAKWYRKRVRDDFFNYLNFTEEHFERQIQQRLAHENTSLSDTHHLSGYSYQEFDELNLGDKGPNKEGINN